MIAFNKPPVIGTEISYITDLIKNNNKLCGNGYFAKQCQEWLEAPVHVKKALLTPSCTAALEMAAILINIQSGDEVIMPSYTFVSTANAFVLRGAKIVFVDIRPDTMNIDEKKIESAITNKTKAIVPVHYAGVACEMDFIMNLASQYNLYVIEDAAQGVMSSYKGQPLGTMGHLGCYSFHETKNYTSGGEGGALLVNDERFVQRAEIIHEKGTNRSQFLRGEIDKYTWHDIGSSFLPGELQSAYLYAQLEQAELINKRRLAIWNKYHEALAHLEGIISRPIVPEQCEHNAHMYYIKFKSKTERAKFIELMKLKEIQTQFHYVPLHSSPAGVKYGRFAGLDNCTTMESEKLVRLPLWYNLSQLEVEQIIQCTIDVIEDSY